MMTTMTNDKYNSLFDTKGWKEEFLNEINEGTAKSYARIFTITAEKEEELGKDLNQFTVQELEDILYNFKANNRNTIESYGRIISSYLNWSVERDYSAKNPLKTFKPDDFEKYLTNDETYIPENKLRRYEDLCANYQDAVILRLLFEGVGGNQLSEIRNLSDEDIDYDNKQLRLINTLKFDSNGLPIKYTERFLKVEQRTLDMIEGAIKEKTYRKRNGIIVSTTNNNVRPYTDLVNNEYVVRSSITKTENFSYPVDKFVIYRRVQMLSEMLVIDGLTTKFVQRSGMMYHANNLIKDGELSLDDLKIIADRFNMKSYHNLKGFLTVENIRQTYPLKK